MEAPDIKLAGLKIAEKTALEVVDAIVAPYAKYYAAEKGGAIGEVLTPFIDQLLEKLKEEVVDKIDGEDNL